MLHRHTHYDLATFQSTMCGIPVQSLQKYVLSGLLEAGGNRTRVREVTGHLVSLLVGAAEDALIGPALGKRLRGHLPILTRTEQLSAGATGVHHVQELGHASLSPGNRGPQSGEVDVALGGGEVLQEAASAGDLRFIQLVGIIARVESLAALSKRTVGDPSRGALQRAGTQRTVAGEEAGSAQFALGVQRAPLLLLLVTVGEQAPLKAAVAEDGLSASRQSRYGTFAAPVHDLPHVAVPFTVLCVGEHDLLQAVIVERRGVGIQ